jgi:hypothetical protein
MQFLQVMWPYYIYGCHSTCLLESLPSQRQNEFHVKGKLRNRGREEGVERYVAHLATSWEVWKKFLTLHCDMLLCILRI